ncbi:unnamed protein product, partial [marine sediment metagenome]
IKIQIKKKIYTYNLILKKRDQILVSNARFH